MEGKTGRREAKRVLLVAGTCPGPWGGAAQYERHLVTALAALGCETVLVFASQGGPVEPDVLAATAEQEGPFVGDSSALVRRIRQLRGAVAGRSLLVAGGCPEAMRRAVLEAVERHAPDCAIVSHLGVGEFVPVLRRYAPSLRIVFVDHNCETDVRRLYRRHGSLTDRLAARFDLPRVREFERQAVEESDAVVVLSHRDADLVREFFQPRAVAVLPPCVTFSVEAPPPAPDPSGEPHVLACGTMSYRAKQVNAEWLATGIYPALRKRVPEVRLDIVGPGAPRKVRQAAWRDPQVNVPGWVDSVEPYYRRAAACVLPTLVGGGFELKVLEAIRYGRPIVGTSIPLDAAGLQDGVHALRADSEEVFAEALCRLVREPKLGQALALAALEKAGETYSRETFQCRLWDLLDDLP